MSYTGIISTKTIVIEGHKLLAGESYFGESAETFSAQLVRKGVSHFMYCGDLPRNESLWRRIVPLGFFNTSQAEAVRWEAEEILTYYNTQENIRKHGRKDCMFFIDYLDLEQIAKFEKGKITPSLEKHLALRNSYGGYSIVLEANWNGSCDVIYTGTYEECEEAINNDKY